MPPRAPRARAQAARGAVARARLGGRDGARRSPAPRWPALFDACVAGDPVRAGGGVPGPREGQARRPRRRAAARRARRRRGRRRCTASRTRSSEIRDRGVPGFDVEVDRHRPNVDRRLSAVAEVDVPFYAGPEDRRAEPAGDRRGARRGPLRPRPPLLARAGRAGRRAHRAGHGAAGGRQLPHRARPPTRGLRSGDASARGRRCGWRWRLLRPVPTVVLSPSAAVRRRRSRARASPPERIGRWDRGVDLGALRPRAAASPALLPGRGQRPLRGAAHARRRASTCSPTPSCARARATRACTSARGRRPGGGRRCASASASTRRSSAGSTATSSPRAYASADLFLFASRTDTFGQVLLEAQASGLPVVAVAEGGPCELVEDGVTGPAAPAGRRRARRRGARPRRQRPPRARRIARAGRAAVAERSWERALGRLADGYRARARRAGDRGAGAPGRLTRSDAQPVNCGWTAACAQRRAVVFSVRAAAPLRNVTRALIR